MMDNDAWINPNRDFRQRLHGYPPPPPPPPRPTQPHTVSGQPRLLQCSVVNLNPFEERNTILELEQANQKLKDMNQELREQLEDIMEPREMRHDFMCPNHQQQLQILSWKELQQMRLSFERKKTSITEVWDGMSEVHMSLTDQTEGLLNLKKDIGDVLKEVEDIRMEILRDKAWYHTLTRKGLLMQKKKPSQPPPRCPDDQMSRKSWTILSKAGLCLLVCSILFYLCVVNSNPYESLLPLIISQKTVWSIRTWCNPFLRVEVDDFLPF